MDQEEGLTAVDNIVTQFNTYEDFLDSQITTVDLYYLEVRAAAPQSGPRLPLSPSFPSPLSWSGRPLAVKSGNVRLRSFPTAAPKQRGAEPPGLTPPRRASVLREFGSLLLAAGVETGGCARTPAGSLQYLSLLLTCCLPAYFSKVIACEEVAGFGGLRRPLAVGCNSGLARCFSLLCHFVLRN